MTIRGSTDVVLDDDRQRRLGFPEIIYGESKSADQVMRIVRTHVEAERDVLVTRLQDSKVPADVPAGAYDPIGRTLLVRNRPAPPGVGHVTVISGGSSDAPVVAEAARTLDFLGFEASTIQDVGVAGIQRLLDRTSQLATAQAIIVVAGFEGALASVVAGLFPQPVIGVPTSVGYGVAHGGHAALNAMLASCANGLLVTNIDNGCGAALAAARILRAKAT